MPVPLQTLFDNLLHVASAAQTDWGALHPLLVHFPLVLLLIAPLFVLAGLVLFQQRSSLYGCALAMVLLGTLSLYITASSGEMAGEKLTKLSAETVQTLETHYELAELAEKIFLGLSAAALALYMLLVFSKWNAKRGVEFSAALVFLLAYGLGAIILLNAAHYGGKLVHKHNVHTSLYSKDRP